MADAFERVLRLVAEGRLTAAEAASLLDALGADGGSAAADLRPPPASPEPGRDTNQETASSIRIEVTESGRKVINLRVPVSLGRMALDRVPGLSGTNAELVREALAAGRSGTLLVIDEDGSGVRIALE